MKSLITTLVSIFSCHLFLMAQENSPIYINDLIEIFNIEEKVEVIEKTEEVRNRYGISIIAAHIFKIGVNDFSTVQTLVTEGGFLLNDSRKSILEQQSPFTERIDLADGGVAYIGLEGAGPGGEGYFALANIAHKNIDFQIKIIIKNEQEIQDYTNDSSKYKGILSNENLLRNSLKNIIISGVEHIVKADAKTYSIVRKSSESSRARGDITAASSKYEMAKSSNEDIAHVGKSKPLFKTWSILGFVCFCMVVGIGILINKRKSKQ